MNFLKNIFRKKTAVLKSNHDFWVWFETNEKAFFEVVKSRGNPETEFFNKLSPKLAELKDGYYFLTGMYDDNTAELIFTPDGNIKNIAFVEELVATAPQLPRWKFTALKPALAVEDVNVQMEGYKFNKDTLSFYATEHKSYPDLVDITIVNSNYKEEDKSIILSGTFIFLDNFLGELNSVTTIDNITIVPKEQDQNNLIPIARLKEYLIWREKEFVEKYTSTRRNTKEDSYSSLQAKLKSGKPLIAVVNTTLLDWDSKASHPWILLITIPYNGNNNNGMPDDAAYTLLNEFEDAVMQELKDSDGYLNIGRQSAENVREIYFACADFRKPSLLLHQLQLKYAGKLEPTYDIYKDKYWQSFERFRIS